MGPEFESLRGHGANKAVMRITPSSSFFVCIRFNIHVGPQKGCFHGLKFVERCLCWTKIMRIKMFQGSDSGFVLGELRPFIENRKPEQIVSILQTQSSVPDPGSNPNNPLSGAVYFTTIIVKVIDNDLPATKSAHSYAITV